MKVFNLHDDLHNWNLRKLSSRRFCNFNEALKTEGRPNSNHFQNITNKALAALSHQLSPSKKIIGMFRTLKIACVNAWRRVSRFERSTEVWKTSHYANSCPNQMHPGEDSPKSSSLHRKNGTARSSVSYHNTQHRRPRNVIIYLVPRWVCLSNEKDFTVEQAFDRKNDIII